MRSTHSLRALLPLKTMPINKLLHFSKKSDNRVCLTLSSENSAKELLNKVMVIQGQALKFRSFDLGQNVYKYKRIDISNILPQIPAAVIIDHLRKHAIFTKNGITNIRCSSSIELRKHVQSHRRQFYVKEEDVNKIPVKIKIVFSETPFWIFLGADDIKCPYCKNFGHIAKYCPQLMNAGASPGRHTTRRCGYSTKLVFRRWKHQYQLSWHGPHSPAVSMAEEGNMTVHTHPGSEFVINSSKLKRLAP